MLLSSYYTLNS